MNHHHHLNFYQDRYPQLSTDQRAASLIDMQKQIQQLLITRNDIIDHKNKFGSDFKIRTNFYPDIDYQIAYTLDDLTDALTPAAAQGTEYNQYSYKQHMKKQSQ